MLINKISQNILVIISVLFILLNYIIFDINYPNIKQHNILIYQSMLWLMTFILFFNYKKINFSQFLIDFKYLLIITLILFFNSFFIPGGNYSRSYLIINMSGFFLMLIIFKINASKMIKYAFGLLLILISIYNILGIYGALFKIDSFFGIIPNELVDNYRYSSILSNPNALGEFSFIAFFIITFFFITNENKKIRLLLVFLYIITGMGLLVSASRTAILMSGIVYIVVNLYYRYLDKTLKKILKYLNIFGVLLVSMALLLKGEFIISLLRLNQGLNGRVEIWSYIIKNIKNNWLFGLGFNMSSFAIYDSQLFASVFSPHNMYLGLLLEMGIIAFIILIIWFFIIIFKNHSFIKQNSNNSLIRNLIMLNAFFISFYIGQMFEFSFLRISAMNTFVFLVLAINYKFVQDFISSKVKEKKKIAHIITGLDNGGAESMLYKIVKNIDKSKFELLVISMNDEGYYGNKIKELGIRVYSLNFKKIIFLPFNIIRVLIILRDTDVIQTWMYHANLFGFFVAKILGKKIIWGVRQSNLDIDANKKLIVKMAETSARLSNHVDYILSCSDETTKVHQALGYKKDKFVTIYNGFEIDKYYFDEDYKKEIRSELNIKDDELMILNVARWDIQKDHHTLFNSIKNLINDLPEISFKLVLCGKGITNDNKELISMLEENNIVDYVLLLGVRPDINKIMSASDIFVLSSLGEGFPNVLGEAMACQNVCVSTNVGDCKEIIGDCGFIVNKQNPYELSIAIKEVIQLSIDDRYQLGKKSRKRVINNYEISLITRQYESLY